MFKTFDEFIELLVNGKLYYNNDKQYWLNLSKEFDKFLDTVPIGERMKFFEENPLAMEMFNREVGMAKSNVDISKIKFYDRVPTIDEDIE